MSQETAAEIANVSVPTWKKWEDDEASPDVDALELFALAAGENFYALLTGETIVDLGDEREIPIIDRIPAGPLTQGFGEMGIIGYTRTSIKDPEAFALIVTGTSMVPEIQEEDIVVVSPRQPFINGKVYATVIGEGEQSLKRVRHDKRMKSYALIPTNKEFPTLYVPEEQIVKLVRVVEVRRDLQ